MACSEKSYIEADTTDDISTGHIKTVRVSKDSYKTYFDYLFNLYASQLDESEKIQMREFKDILALLDKNRIVTEVSVE